ncbi:MAG: mechanosensitive ion channel [Atopobiaceae bacterium]|nr:mechanosensitive ion channel [Atopobiaceae bacterium]
MLVGKGLNRILTRRKQLASEWREVGGLRTLKTILLVTIPVTLVLMLVGGWTSYNRECEQDALVTRAVANLVAPAIKREEGAKDYFQEDLVSSAKLEADLLKEFVTDDVYDGPRILKDGFVVDLKDGQIVYPEGFKDGCLEATARDLLDTEKTGVPFTCLIDSDTGLDIVINSADEDDGDSTKTSDADGAADEDTAIEIMVLVTAAHITGDTYYLDVTSEYEEDRYISDHEVIDKQVSAVEQAYEGAVLLIDAGAESLPLAVNSSYFKDCSTASELGLEPDDLSEEGSYTADLNGDSYTFVITKVEDTDYVVAYLRPLKDAIIHGASRSLVAVVAMWLVFVALATYALSVKSYVKERPLTRGQTVRFDPDRIHQTLLTIGLAGTLLVVVVGCFSEAMGSLHIEVINGRNSLNVLLEQLKKNERDVRKTAYQREGDWYVYFASRIASMAADYPQLMTKSKLQDLCNDISADYIMIFDSEGKEIACNKDYVGFKLGEGHGENSSDFLRLQQGVSRIVHESSKGEVTGLQRWVVGVPVPKTNDQEKKGALLIAIDPSRMERTQGLLSLDQQIEVIANDDATYFIADAESGVIKHSSNSDLTGRTVVECDLSDKSLVDGFTNFAVVDDQPCFVLTKRTGSTVNYYAVANSYVFKMMPIFGVAVAVCYLPAMLILVARLLKEYTREYFDECIVQIEQARNVSQVTDGQSSESEDTVFDKLAAQTDAAFSQWQAMMPEERTRSVIMFSLCMVLMIVFLAALNPAHLHLTENRLLDFIMYGDWMRGPNLFAVCSILIVVARSFCAIVISRALYELLAKFLDRRAQTVCRLAYSFIEYMILGVLIYQSFGYLGFPTSTILGSLGLVGMALTMGSRELVSDIVAGVYIVFEGQYQVGDMVEIGNFRGWVKEIGVRATKVVDESNHIKIIGNTDVKNVVNLSKYNAKCLVNIKAPSTESIERIEGLLNSELPNMAQGCPSIVSGPTYIGITDLTGGNMTLTFTVECSEEDCKPITRYLNRELILLFQREGITVK